MKTALTIFLALTVFFSTTIYYVSSQSASYVVSPFGMVKTASYIIYQDGSTYYSIDGVTGVEFTSGSDKATVQEDTLDEMSDGLLFLKGNTLDSGLSLEDDETVIEEYLGQYRVYSNQGKFLVPQLASDPSTGGWGATEEGRLWYNTVDNLFKYWNGSHVNSFEGSQGEQGEPGAPGTGGLVASSYIVYLNGSTVYAVDGMTGEVLGTDSTAYPLIWAVGNLTEAGGGSVYVGEGEYDLPEEVVLDGGGDYDNPITIMIRGAGMYATKFNTAQNEYGFRVVNGCSAFLSDFGVVISATNGQSAIYGDDSGAGATQSGDNSMFRGELRNLFITGAGSSTGVACVHLKNPYFWSWSGTNRIEVDSTGGIGIFIDNTEDDNKNCDGHVDGYFHIRTSKADTIAIRGQGTSGWEVGMIKWSAFIYYYAGGTTTNTTAVFLDEVQYWTFDHLAVEGCVNVLDITNTESISASLEYIHCTGTVFELNGGSTNKNFRCLKLAEGSDSITTLINDNQGSYLNRPILQNIYIAGSATITAHSVATFNNVVIYSDGVSESGGTGTIANTDTYVDVTHYLFKTPQFISVDGTHDEVSNLKITNVGASTFRVEAVDGATTGDRTFYWSASVNQYN